MLCSRCKVDQPPENFSPKPWIDNTRISPVDFAEIRYRFKCKRGRSYHCKTCRNKHAREVREREAGKVSANSVPAKPS